MDDPLKNVSHFLLPLYNVSKNHLFSSIRLWTLAAISSPHRNPNSKRAEPSPDNRLSFHNNDSFILNSAEPWVDSPANTKNSLKFQRAGRFEQESIETRGADRADQAKPRSDFRLLREVKRSPEAAWEPDPHRFFCDKVSFGSPLHRSLLQNQWARFEAQLFLAGWIQRFESVQTPAEFEIVSICREEFSDFADGCKQFWVRSDLLRFS